jgi:hypothetical protein
MIVAGYTYYTGPSNVPLDQEHTVHVTVVGRGDRAHLDELVRRAPQELRGRDEQLVRYFLPLAEGGRPEFGARRNDVGESIGGGVYLYDGYGPRSDAYPKLSHAWWKQVDQVLP